MAELSFKQITDKLNEEFSDGIRKLIFWYDANAEFQDEVSLMELNNAKILHLEQDNQFYIKYFLEKEDTTGNYLIYAPFSKPDIRENHLADMIRYSKEFYADRASLLCHDLGIESKYKHIIQKHISFFNNKDRSQAFYGLELDDYNTDSIEIGLMSVLCKNRSSSFEDIVITVIEDREFVDNRFLNEFAKYDLLDAFWQQCDSNLGYSDNEPSLQKLVMTMFVTYFQKTVHTSIPQGLQNYISYKSGSVVTFIDNMMNNVVYGERFDELSKSIYAQINGNRVLEKMEPEDIVDCNVFSEVDKYVIKWIVSRIEAEDVGAKLGERTISELCEYRLKMHFGHLFEQEYEALRNAFYMMAPNLFSPASSVDGMAKDYITKDYLIDYRYRLFYCSYDRIEDTSDFEAVRDLVEGIYTNDYLNKIMVAWNTRFVEEKGQTRLDNQLDFFSKYVKFKKERLVVIISDALRYEVGHELYEKLQQDAKCECKISAMQSVLPSVTSYGMAALLPHRKIRMDNDYKVLCDGQPCADLKQREAILHSVIPNSKCVQYDDVKLLKASELKAFTAGTDVIYVYHNQIDARGDKLSTENEVFTACREAVDEIARLIRDFTTKGNVLHFIVTADHGFVYKRDKLHENDKISGMVNCGKRYAISDSAITIEGVSSIPMKIYDQIQEEYRFVCSPIGSDVFKAPGAGMNYVHGGCSPQEMIIPVIEVKTDKSHVATMNVRIDILSLTNKITNLNIRLNFIQKDPVSDLFKETKYHIFFIDEEGNRISNENIYVADNRETDDAKRVFKMRFTFKNQSYDMSKKYFLVAIDDKTNVETIRREVIMDLAFAGDFGFGV